MANEGTSNYGPDLLRQHARKLAASAVHPRVAHSRGYRSVTSRAGLKPFGFASAQRSAPALLIPIWGVTRDIVTYQLRRDEPRVVDGRPVKYETPASTKLVLDVPRLVHKDLGDPSKPLYITEGPLKADAAVSKGLCCIALLGVWGFRGTNAQGGRVVLADWESIALNGRTVYICFDSDVMTKLPVHGALVRLKAFLERRGADVLLVYLPADENGAKVGLDDFFAADHTVSELHALATHELRPAASEDDEDPAESAADFKARLAEFKRASTPVLEADDPLEIVKRAIIAAGYGGDPGPAMLVYLAATSRLLRMRTGAMPVHLLLLGVPSAGKSYTLKLVLSLFPEDVRHVIDAGSPRVLIYDDADLRHRIVVFSEADSLPAGEDNPAASAIRNLLVEHELRYEVVLPDPETRRPRVHEVKKPGPTVLITTAIHRLGNQLDSRLFSIEVPEDLARIQAALDMQANLELDDAPHLPDTALIAFQGLLQAQAPWDVVVPFVRPLNRAIGRSVPAPRILRDAARIISLIKAVAILRHQHRKRNATGRLVAHIDDYRAVFALVADMYEGSATGASKAVRAVVEAVRDCKKARLDKINLTVLARRLNISKMSASRRVSTAIKEGWLTNAETRKGYPHDLGLGEPLPQRAGLPEPDALTTHRESRQDD